MKILEIYQVDVFTEEVFKGNPAAVCILDKPIEESEMKAIAGEMNLSETAFVMALDKEQNLYSIRWFTPVEEVPLCGHGTIGAAKVLFDIMEMEANKIIFETKSGRLIARRYEDGIGIDMPLDTYKNIDLPIELLDAMGIDDYVDGQIGELTRKLIIRVEDEEDIINLNPNFNKMINLDLIEDIKGVAITTNRTLTYDFISRYFNPWAGINEDPVTGSVHTVLARYWGNILKKSKMTAYQASPRGGELTLEIKDNNRLEIVARSIVVLEGRMRRSNQGDSSPGSPI